ncbi:MAG TPA: TlpA family protein disulfide reductase [Candidatus Treponema faecavium]|nr:TlpA family protein disulfide reductase [Candidatus Treponema faecavium]
MTATKHWCAALCALLCCALPLAAQRAVGLNPGNLAPDFTVKTVDGGSVTLSELRGKPVMLHFWATWCPPCVEELPHIADVALNRSDEITVLAVSAGENRKMVSDYLAKRGGALAELNSGYDDNGAVSLLYRVAGVPFTLFIDSDGVITDGQIGAYTKDTLTAAVNAAVAG